MSQFNILFNIFEKMAPNIFVKKCSFCACPKRQLLLIAHTFPHAHV